jgi:hypothetical protein
MAFIHREFLMRLDQLARVIVNFLPETHRGFARVHVLEITRQPAQPAWHVEPVTPPTAGQLVLPAKLFLILRSRAHGLPYRMRLRLAERAVVAKRSLMALRFAFSAFLNADFISRF